MSTIYKEILSLLNNHFPSRKQSGKMGKFLKDINPNSKTCLFVLYHFLLKHSKASCKFLSHTSLPLPFFFYPLLYSQSEGVDGYPTVRIAPFLFNSHLPTTLSLLLYKVLHIFTLYQWLYRENWKRRIPPATISYPFHQSPPARKKTKKKSFTATNIFFLHLTSSSSSTSSCTILLP